MWRERSSTGPASARFAGLCESGDLEAEALHGLVKGGLQPLLVVSALQEVVGDCSCPAAAAGNELPQEGYWRACQQFNSDPARRRCASCGAEHPPVDLTGVRWPELARELRAGVI